MKRHIPLMAALASATATCATVPAHAEIVLNVPYEAGSTGGACEANPVQMGMTGGGLCQSDFPISLPPGYTIKQITLLHGSYNSSFQQVGAGVMVQAIAPPWTVPPPLFVWDSFTPVPLGTVARTNLMGQAGGYFPDAFSTQSNRMYHVRVTISAGAIVYGLQVLYDPCADCS